jgi:hypothetical protein
MIVELNSGNRFECLMVRRSQGLSCGGIITGSNSNRGSIVSIIDGSSSSDSGRFSS